MNVEYNDFKQELFKASRCEYCLTAHRNLLIFVRVINQWVCPNHIDGALNKFIKELRRI